jgi:hypothetical protein
VVYLRIKKIKGKEYAYLVKSKWSKSGPKQKVKAYLGRVYRLGKEKDVDFWKSVDAEPESYLRLAAREKILHDLVRFELMKHGFADAEGKWVKDIIKADIKRKKFVNNMNSDCVLAMNEGYLCSHRLKELIKYSADGSEESGYKLAKLFIESGIDVPQDVFIAYYEKS